MKAPALSTCGNLPVDGGAQRTRDGWQRWGARRLSATERAQGWVCVVALFAGYYRIGFAAQPCETRIRLNGSRVTA